MLTAEQIARLQEFADQKSGDPHLDAMKTGVLKTVVRKQLS